MQISSQRLWGAFVAIWLALLPMVSAERMLTSSSLTSCQANSSFGTSLFDVVFTPGNNSLAFNIVGTSTIVGNVTIHIDVLAYGLSAFSETINPCESGFMGVCPMTAGPLTIESHLDLPASATAAIPGIAYTFPDLDAKVIVRILSEESGIPLACVQAELSNGKSVYVPAVCWVLAIIVGLGLIASAITSGMGNSITATAVSSNTIAMFSYFQSQALLGMLAVPYPPIFASWTQNFQWSMGIIRVEFIQTICTWYQRATGGTPSSILSSLSSMSVQVQKRSIDTINELAKRSMAMVKRATIDAGTTATASTHDSNIVLRGIERVGFRAHIETTNIFLTGYIFFLIFVLFTVILVVLFKLICDLLVKSGKMKHDTFEDLRVGFRTTLKGILFRVALISFPQLCVLCFWQLTQRDSAAEVVLAIVTIVSILGLLIWSSVKVMRMARNAKKLGLSPVSKLYGDVKTFNKWGFLYVQYNCRKNYHFFAIALGYVFIKCLFVAFGQGSGTVQAFAFLIIELAMLVLVCVTLPYMDKRTNAWNITIYVISFFNSILLVFFTGITNVPGIAIGVMGVLIFVVNAIFALTLLIMLLVASASALLRKNPDRMYRAPPDDRSSYIRSKTSLNDELAAMGATARQQGPHHSSSGSFSGEKLSDRSNTQDLGYSEKTGLRASGYNRSDSHSPSPLRDGDEEIGYHSPNQRLDDNGVVHDWSKQGVGY